MKRTNVAIEKSFEKTCSEPKGLAQCDALLRKKICAQKIEWAAAEEEEEDDE